MIGGAEKLKLVRELGSVRKALPGAKGVDKLGMVKRIKEIRLLLGGKPSKTNDIAIDPKDKAGSMAALVDYAENCIKSTPTALLEAESKTIEKVWVLLRKLPNGDKPDPSLDYYGPLSHTLSNLSEHSGTQVDVFNHFADAGRLPDSFNGDEVLALKNDIDNLRAVDSPEIVEKMKELDLLSDELSSRIKSLNSARMDYIEKAFAARDAGDIDGESDFNAKAAALYEEYQLLSTQRRSISDEWAELSGIKYSERTKKDEEIRVKIKSQGQSVIDSLHAESPITQEQADTWANAVDIDKSIVTRLKKNGYPVEDLRRDIAEFYKITQGKLRTIAMRSTGAKRAHAGGIHDFEGNYITPGSSFTKTTLWHELAHHLEADAAALWGAKGFLEKRRKSPQLYSLRSLTGNRGYHSSESAYEDEFLNHYIGKYYVDSTEVFSMGVQYLAEPEQAAYLAAKDPEMFKLIAGYLTTDLSPAMKALQKAQFVAADESQFQRDDFELKYQNALRVLADGVEIVDDGWFSGLDDISKDALFNDGWGSIGDKNAKFVGSWNGFRVFSGKFKAQIKPRRVANGYKIAYELRQNSLKNERGYISTPDFSVIQGDISKVKVGMRIAKASYDNDMYRVAWSIFGPYDSRSTIIVEAQKIKPEGSQQ
jgi:hypothetical protein